jgi:hypothetical protein
MSNYTKTVNFAAKDALTTGDANKIVKGTEIDTEFNNIATAVATKYDSSSPVPASSVTAGTFSSGVYTFNSSSFVAFGASNPSPSLWRMYVSALSGNPALVADRGNSQYANCIVCNDNVAGSAYTRPFITFTNNNSTMAAISTSDGATIIYGTGSDYRLKTNVTPLSGSVAKVKALKPCSYNWVKAPTVSSQGFLAHELAEVVPQAVSGEKDALYPDGSVKIQQVDLSYVIPVLTAALQEAFARIEALESK